MKTPEQPKGFIRSMAAKKNLRVQEVWNQRKKSNGYGCC